jgi:hypothetical protein
MLATFSAISPFRNTGGCYSPELMVFEAPYFVAKLAPSHTPDIVANRLPKYQMFVS